jgi:type I restriction enzyme S subunit
MGQAPPSATCNRDGRGTVFVKAGEFSSRRPVVREWTTSPLKMAGEDDVLVCVVGATAGKVNQGLNCAIGRSVAAIRPTSPGVLSDYLYRFISTREYALRAQSQGLAQGVLTREMLSAIDVPLPSLDEQRRIVAILDHADVVRRRSRQALTLLDELLGSVYADSLCRTSGPPVSLKEAGVDFEAGKNVVGTGVDVHPLRRVIKVSAISRGVFDPLESKPLPLAYVPPETHRIRHGDVLFGRASGSLELLGATVQVDEVPDEMFLPDKVWRAVVRPGGRMTAGYLLGTLQSPRFRAFVRHNASGAAGVRNIGKGKVLEYQLSLPPVGDQDSYARQASRIQELRRRGALRAEQMDGLFASLQARAFAGRL